MQEKKLPGIKYEHFIDKKSKRGYMGGYFRQLLQPNDVKLIKRCYIKVISPLFKLY